jgi:hypothetical protein
MAFVYEQERRLKLQQMPEPVEYQPESSFGETYMAAYRYAVDEEMSISGALNREGWKQRQRAVRELADNDEINLQDYTDKRGRIDYDRLATRFDSVKSTEQLDTERREFLRLRREENQGVMDRGSGLAQFLGYASAFALDPINLATLPVSTAATAARSLSWFARGLIVARNEAALSVAAELAIQPLVFQHKSDIESPYSWQDAVANIGLAAVGSAGLGFVAGGVAGYLKAARQKIEPFADPIKEDMQLRSLEDIAKYLEDTKPNTVSRALDEEYGKFLSKEYDSLETLRVQTKKRLTKELKEAQKEDVTVLRMIADMGGLDQKAWASEGVDPGYFTKSGALRKGMQPGKPLFRKTGGMRPSDLAEKLYERGVFVRGQYGNGVDDSMALELVHSALADTDKPFNIEARAKIEDIQRQLQDLDAADIDVMENIYRDAQRMEIDSDLERLRELHVNLEQMNQPNRVPENYIMPERKKVAPQTLHERQRAVLDEIGLAEEYDEAMEAYARTERKQVWDPQTEQLIDADDFLEELDREIEGLDEVLRCTVGA